MLHDRPALALLASLIGEPGSRERIPTPALLLDIDALDRNIARMAARASAAGIRLRPHAKSHKSAFIAHRQIDAGALGVCCAKLGEAEALAAAGIGPLLLSSPVAGPDNWDRAARLARQCSLLQVIDHPGQATGLAQAGAALGARINVLIDVDVGLARTGVSSVEQALTLAGLAAEHPSMRLLGVQGYGGHWQHIEGEQRRRDAMAQGMQTLQTIIQALRDAGHDISIVTGGGTGSFAADVALGVLTDLQPGSYVFMDRQYRDALGDDADGAFEPSLWVLTSIISANARGHVTVDAGLKAMATDGPLPQVLNGRFSGCEYRFFGDEHGWLARPRSDPFAQPGERIELLVPHCDPTVDRYDHLVLVRGDTVVNIVPIDAARCAQ